MSAKKTPLSWLCRYGVSAAVALVSVVLAATVAAVSDASVLFVILEATLFTAWYGDLGPGLFTTAVSTTAIAVYFMAPRGSLFISLMMTCFDLSYLWSFP